MDRVWLDQSSIDIWLTNLWESLPDPKARYIPGLFVTPQAEGGDVGQLDKETDTFRDFFLDLPPRGTSCPFQTLVYVLNSGPNPKTTGNHFCVVVMAPADGVIHLLGMEIGKNQSNNNSRDWDSWNGSQIWSKVCRLMGWVGLSGMVLRKTDWRQNGYDCGPIACLVAEHILSKGLKTELTGTWKRPRMMTCCHMLRLKMAEQVYQAITDGNKKYTEIRNRSGRQLEEKYGYSELKALDDSQKELQTQLDQSAWKHLLPVQTNLKRAILACSTCHEMQEEVRQAEAAKNNPTPLWKENAKQAMERQRREMLQGAKNTKDYVAGVPEIDDDMEEPNYHHEDGQDLNSMEDIGQKLPNAPRRRGPDVDPKQAKIGRFPRPKEAPELPPRTHLRGLLLPFNRFFDEYEGGPPLEDLFSINDTHLQLRPSFLYLCKQITLTPVPFSLFKEYGYRLLPCFAQAFDLRSPVLVKQHLCPAGLSKPPTSITDYYSPTSKGRHGQNIQVDDRVVVGAEGLLDMADVEGDDLILLTGRSLEGQYVCVDLLLDAVQPDGLALSCDIDSIIWTTKNPRFMGAVDVYSIPVIRDRAPIWKNNHVKVQLLYPQSQQDIDDLGPRSDWETSMHSLSTLPHLLFGVLPGSSPVDIMLFFPRMMHKNGHHHFSVNRIPKAIQDYFWDKVLLPALTSVIPPTRTAYFPVDRSHSAFKLGSGKQSAKFSLAPEQLVKMVEKMNQMVRAHSLCS